MASNGISKTKPQKNMDFHGKAVIVTGKNSRKKIFFKISFYWLSGSSRGIGRAVALALAKSGASVTIHGQNQDKLNVRQFEK
jgi:NAD(P)-dependent dehydrogenase (short-subunit alcohol dehydrogenase family)